ncbi:triosephosphate isomerase [Salmonella enterica subsp. diarizonae]|nr:triosephosphate isomerase [Salmonella enterica subsp. diarizonae]
MRHPLVMGNWKLNGSRHMVNELVANLRKELAGVAGCDVAIAPPEMYIDLAKRAAAGSHIMLGAQNVDLNLSGAFTGETSAEMLKDIGAQYIIIGHSERRTYHKESDELIAKKFAVLKEQGLTPVLCIGETEAENEAGKTEEVCARQIDAVLKTQGAAAFEGVVIAYEPVWAIGTGKSATRLRRRRYTNSSATTLPKLTLKSLSRSLSSTAVPSTRPTQPNCSRSRTSTAHW